MNICEILWVGFLVVWIIWAVRTKPTQMREGVSSCLSYTIINVAAFYLMFSGDVPLQYLRTHLFSSNPVTEAVGIAITFAGIVFAVWARVYLGGNWSSTVTLKVGHQLVRSGPYRWVRHPIYTGMILGMLGTAIVRAQVRGAIAVVLVYIGFKIKSKIEERVMTETFGTQYDDYRSSTGAILPKLRF